MRREFIILFVILYQFSRYRRKNLELTCLLSRLFKLSKNILQHLRFAIILFLNKIKTLEYLTSNLQLFMLIKVLFNALFLKISPLSLDTLIKFISKPQNIHPHIILLAICYKQFEIIFHLFCLFILFCLHF